MILMMGLSWATNHLLVSLIVSICCLLCVYLANYIRICYYVLKIRGPRAYPIVGNALSLGGSNEDRTNFLCKVATDYPIITRLWIGPFPELLVTETKAIQELLTSVNSLEKDTIMKTIFKYAKEQIFISADVPIWKRSRNIIVKGFTVPILKSYFKVFSEKVNRLTERLDKELNKANTFDIYEIISKTTLDAACASSMGVDLNSNEGDAKYFEAVRRLLHVMALRIFNPLKYPNVLYKLTQDYKIFSQCSDYVRSVANEVIAENRKKYQNENRINLNNLNALNKNVYKRPLLDYMFDSTLTNPDYSTAQLAEDLNFVILAAFETTSKTISMVLLLLALFKDEQNKVYEELYEVLNKPDKIDYEDLSKLKYLEMFMKETMRLFPAIPFITRQLTKDMEIEGFIFPNGVNIMIPIFSVHRNENYWENPSKFDPQRFSHENFKNQHPYAFIPFSAGSRNCLGDRYAWILMKLTIASLLSRYEFHTNIKDMSDIRYEFQITLNIKDGYPVRLTPRQTRNL